MSVLNGPSMADMEVWCEQTIDSAAESSVKTAASHLLVVYRERGKQVERLRAEVAALKKDADRYRWLRSSFRVARWDVKYWTGEFWDVMYGDAMDKQIDAALKEGS